MAENIKVNIVSPSGEVFSGEAISVQVPGSLGQMTILPKHAAILSSLSKGTIRVNTSVVEVENFRKSLELFPTIFGVDQFKLVLSSRRIPLVPPI